VGIGVLRFPASDKRTDAPYIGKDFTDGVKPIITFEHDGFGSMAGENAIKESERSIGYRVGMGIGEEGTI
jgi:hypothetical protein